MTISELRTQKILPFEIVDTKMISLFSFFLHSAPTIESNTAMIVEPEKLLKNWQSFLEAGHLNPSIIYAESYSSLESACEKKGLGLGSTINRETKGFVCIRKGKESDYECVLRHIRNLIAHNNVYYAHAGNRKFVLFEDYNKGGKFTARILLSQTVLSSLKKEITK